MNTNFLSKLYTGIAALCLVILAAFPVTGATIAQAAGPTLDVLGYAWSYHPVEQSAEYDQHNVIGSTGLSPLGTQGFGWISMSGANPSSGGGSYKVTLDPTTGKFAGYAWSENGGWVNFAPAGPYPSGTGTTSQAAAVDPTCLADKTRTCPVKGWIRFVNGTTGTSNWDGWVSMDVFNDATAVSAYKFPLNAPGKGVQLMPESAGFRNMSGYAWGDNLAGIIGFAQAKVKLMDVCPDTNFNQTSNPKNTGIDPLTAGTQTTLPTKPKGYEVRDGLCGIFGCTDKTAANYNKNATIDDGSCVPNKVMCPDGITPAPNGNPKLCPEETLCPDGSVAPKGDLSQCPQPPTCPNGSPIPSNGVCPGGDPENQCKNVEGFQGTVAAPYTQVIQAGVKNCYVIGCTDPYANNYNKDATMSANPDICTYDNPGETCKQKGNCPNLPTAPKKPIYIET